MKLDETKTNRKFNERKLVIFCNVSYLFNWLSEILEKATQLLFSSNKPGRNAFSAFDAFK